MFSLFRRLPEDDYREQVLDALKKAMPECEIAIDEADPLHVSARRHGEENGLDLYLHNLIQDLEAAEDRKERAFRIANYAGMARQALFPPELTLDKVYLGLRHRDFVAQVLGEAGEDALVEDGPGDMQIVILHDIGEGVGVVLNRQAETAGIAPGEIRAAAERNFLALLEDYFFTCAPEPGILSLCLEDHDWVANTLMLTPQLMTAAMTQAGWARALIAAPTRGSVDMVDASDPNAIARMAEWMQACHATDPRRQSEFVWSMSPGDETWVKTHRMGEDGRLIALS